MPQPSMTSDRPATSYDEVPYESLPFAQTHPDRLATVATLFGMRPAPADRSRVLELGCAAGGNLIPMALALPQSRFLGTDLSGRQIADGQKVVGALGLTNIELKHLSITEVDAGAARGLEAELAVQVARVARRDLVGPVAAVRLHLPPGPGGDVHGCRGGPRVDGHRVVAHVPLDVELHSRRPDQVVPVGVGREGVVPGPEVGIEVEAPREVATRGRPRVA